MWRWKWWQKESEWKRNEILKSFDLKFSFLFLLIFSSSVWLFKRHTRAHKHTHTCTAQRIWWLTTYRKTCRFYIFSSCSTCVCAVCVLVFVAYRGAETWNRTISNIPYGSCCCCCFNVDSLPSVLAFPQSGKKLHFKIILFYSLDFK